MPRLRYYKKFEQITENNYETESNTESDVFSGLSGQSWWSNNTIISNLTDSKIRQAILYHKQMAKQMEEELFLRSVGKRTYVPYVDKEFRSSSRLDRKQIRGTDCDISISDCKKETKFILRNLQSTLRSIRKRNGQVAFEKCKKEWTIVLENYYGQGRES